MLLLSEKSRTACSLREQGGVVCALSGGPDSVALLLELKRLHDEGGIGPLYAAHFEHGIRGEASREDMAFCRTLCLKLQVPLFVESEDVPAFARSAGLSLETAARQRRYGFLRRIRSALGADAIALGHHQDDQAETVLLHLIRGSGLKGLTGMAPRSADLVRPLLFVSREEILAYLAERGQPYRQDSTNALLDHSRNRLRHQGMGALVEINPRAAEHIARCADRLRAEDEYLDSLARQALLDARGSRKALSALPPVLRDRAAVLLIRGVTEDYTEADVARLSTLFALPSGRQVPLRGGLVARADGDRLILGPPPKNACFQAGIAPGQTVETPFGRYRAAWAQKAGFPCPDTEAYLDGDRLQGALTLRQPRPGDRFTPLGMEGSKLLSDYFIDRKMSRDARQRPVLLDEAGPVFIPGGTVAERVKISDQTQRILHIIYEKGDESHGELGC